MKSSAAAALLLMVAAAAISSSSASESQQSLWRIVSKYTGNLCASQRTASGQTLRDCSQQCRTATAARGIKLHICYIDCWYRFLLGTTARGEAYDKRVQEAGCGENSWTDIFNCRQTALNTAASAQPVLTLLQQYNILVCQHRCPTSLPKSVCSANCQLSQLVDAEAYKKFSECFTSQGCANKPEGDELDKCRQNCLGQC